MTATMLKNLVKKFKSHSLNEDGPEGGVDNPSDHRPETDTHKRHLRHSTSVVGNEFPVAFGPLMSQQSQQQHGQQPPLIRRTCCQHKHATCPHHQRSPQCQGSKAADTAPGNDFYDIDSGTESDEELEYIETNSTHSVPVSQTSDYYASQQSLSINSCRSSHCGSPLLALSDQECNSWESIGSESGINLRATAARQQHQQQQQHHQVQNSTRTSGQLNFSYEFLLNPYKSKNDNNNPEPSTTPTMITEELPNHPYHTRQQFQRLKQQISMKNGDFVSQTDQDQVKTFSSSTNPATALASDSLKRNTAFTAFSRFLPNANTALEKSPGGRSSVDELEEINSNDGSGTFSQPGKNQAHHTCASRRCRSSTLSTVSGMSSSGVSTWSSCSSTSSASSCPDGRGGSWSEKRKWSQMRHQQKQQPCNNDCCCSCRECGLAEVQSRQQQQTQRTVLHAARKTPVKLLFPLTTTAPAHDQKSSASASDGTANSKMEIDQSIRKTRFSTRKKCRGDDEARQDADEQADDGREELVKRPSLDFDKMRAKRVGSSSGIKSRRSNSFNGMSRSKLKEHHQNGYHLRSTRRQRCLFRPLDPPAPTAPTTSGPSGWHSIGGGSGPNLFSVHRHTDGLVRFE